MSGEIEHRVVMGRLLEYLIQMERSARTARAIVQDAIKKLDRSGTAHPPITRDMIIAVMRAAHNEGLSRADIMAAINRDYGVKASPHTITTTLLRMRNANLASRRGVLWFLTIGGGQT